jgi:MFS family permease
MIFSIFQIPENFLMGRTSIELTFACKVILYVCAIAISLCHQLLCRQFGLRKALYLGLLCNLFGITTLLVNHYISKGDGFISLIFLDMVFFGLALTSVINGLVTYTIIEFPKKVGLGVVALFAFFNLGAMCAPLFLEILQWIGMKRFMYLALIGLLLLSIWFVHTYFFDPPTSRSQVQLKKGSVIWKQLHYRLALFVIAIVIYGLTETTFNLWGYIQIKDVLGRQIADETASFFWLFLIIGQIFLLIPLYFIPAKRIFFSLIALIILAAFFFPLQDQLSGYIFWLGTAGFGCSAIFPILLSQMEKEMLPFAKEGRILSYIEKSISLMIAGYFAGVGIIDLWVQLLGNNPYFTIQTHFHFAAAFIGATGLIAFFLSLTAPQTKS